MRRSFRPTCSLSVVLLASLTLSACDSGNRSARNLDETSQKEEARVIKSLSETEPDREFAEGVKYQFGQGVGVDLNLAAKHYEKAANAGHIGAMLNLAALYYDGHGVKQNFQQALELYKRAAQLGDSSALASIAGMYRKGKGVAQNHEHAYHYYTQAAELGNPYAQTAIGEMYVEGQGVKSDKIEAHAWWKMAAENGDPFAEELQKKRGLSLSPDEVERVENRFNELRRRVRGK